MKKAHFGWEELLLHLLVNFFALMKAPQTNFDSGGWNFLFYMYSFPKMNKSVEKHTSALALLGIIKQIQVQQS